jgi:hypothetical protein
VEAKRVLKALNPRVIGRREKPIAFVHGICLEREETTELVTWPDG